MAIDDPRTVRALRRQLTRALGPSALRGGTPGPHEVRALHRARAWDVELPPSMPLSAREPEPEERTPAEVDARVHWLEIVLRDEADQPISGEAYEVELPNGRRLHGRLDQMGSARIDGIEEPGACKVTFPKLDEAAWSRT